jgi:hypothetical protein
VKIPKAGEGAIFKAENLEVDLIGEEYLGIRSYI